MFWSMSFQLLPGEAVIDSSDKSKKEKSGGIKPTYSIFLTNKRVVFRLDSLRSSMIQSFSYDEILGMDTCKRVFINYLRLKTRPKTYFIHVGTPGRWAGKISEFKKSLAEQGTGEQAASKPAEEVASADELLAMLATLERSGILSRREYEEKVNAVREQAASGQG